MSNSFILSFESKNSVDRFETNKMSNTYILYLNDTIRQLINLAKDVSQKDEYNEGVVYGYYASISRLLNQAEGFNIIEQLDDDVKNFEPESLISNQLNNES